MQHILEKVSKTISNRLSIALKKSKDFELTGEAGFSEEFFQRYSELSGKLLTAEKLSETKNTVADLIAFGIVHLEKIESGGSPKKKP